METVSGVAGLIKVVLMMQHDEIVRQTHFESLNPHIKLEGTRLVIPTEHVPWPRGKGRRAAGVSSFGFGGTNTHLIVEAANPKSEIRKSAIERSPAAIVEAVGKERSGAQAAGRAIGRLSRRACRRRAGRCLLVGEHGLGRFQSAGHDCGQRC